MRVVCICLHCYLLYLKKRLNSFTLLILYPVSHQSFTPNRLTSHFTQLALGFRYDNLVMEEAAQVLEVETVIPMLLQPSHDTALASSKSGSAASGGGGGSGTQDTSSSSFGGRLQRVCLIGDHRQLPPVVKNLALQKYSNLDQTLFTRFIRLGVPHVLLDQQGRARPEIAALYSWRCE